MRNKPNEFARSDGNRLIFRQTGGDTQGKLLEMEAVYPPHSPKPPAHYHPYQEEQFQVLAGTFHAQIGDEEKTFVTGDTFSVPANTHHWMHNVSDTEGRLLWQVRPALQTQAFFETMWGLAADGKTNPQGVPNLLQLAVILRAYAAEFRPSSPPYLVQRLLFGFLAPIGRLLGYRARYDKYSSRQS
ncbi:MAG: cupin domain-containing protein [Anaerolineaceae bacterium]|nr:cupin domain-containing protein [Anaerolineaceae bacterium]